MVDFRFDLRPLFPQPIVRVTSNLLPHTFRGDRRQALDTTSKMSEIIDRLGELSAAAQKLTKAVTTAQRLRMSDNQKIYLLADVDAGKNGAIIGLLKVGTKDLYLFDEAGKTKKVENAPCILDFYIHESRQRSGLGKELFETMLVQENWIPVKCSIDRPSEKLLGFLRKHYGLTRTIPQANNFVLYEGFFDDGSGNHSIQHTNGNGMYITDSPNTQLLGAHYLGEEDFKRRQRHSAANNMVNPITQISPAGRYGARRPMGSMAEKTTSEASMTPSQKAASEAARKHPLDALSRSVITRGMEKRSGLQDVNEEFLKQNPFAKQGYGRHSIIHNVDSDPRKNGSFSNRSTSAQREAQFEVQHIIDDMQSLQTTDADTGNQRELEPIETFLEPHHSALNDEAQSIATETQNADSNDTVETVIESVVSVKQQGQNYAGKTPDNISPSQKPLPTFQLSKQHTGMKNISFGVGMAVTPTNKMEFDQESREDFGVVKINRPIAKLKSPPPPQEGDNHSTLSSGEGLTDQGYYDLKFYHNKLW